MKQLIKFLLADEKIVEQLTAQHNELKMNMANETKEDTARRSQLAIRIAVMKKANQALVNHCINDRPLSELEIEKITREHIQEPASAK
jgi:hypothetical protein